MIKYTLEETVAETSPVMDAVRALLEAAAASETSYTPVGIAELVEEQALIVALGEAGGLVSWIKRVFSGTDGKAAGEIKAEIQNGVKSESHRAELMNHIDKLLIEARKAKDSSRMNDSLNPFSDNGGGVIGVILRGKNRDSGAIGRYINALEEVRKDVAAAKVA